MNHYNNMLKIACINLFGIVLLITCFLPTHFAVWSTWDTSIFFFFNHALIDNPTYLWWVAITNHRAFDLISLMAMGSLLLYFYLRGDNLMRRRIICIGCLMLLTGIVLNQLGHLLPIERPSPTLTFEQSHRVSQLSTIPTKDASRDSFPGDHGIMLLIFSGFMLRYFPRWAFCLSILIVVIFSLPRIMAGSHWFSDVYVGSLAIVGIGLSWLLLTPLSDYIIATFMQHFPRRWLKTELSS